MSGYDGGYVIGPMGVTPRNIGMAAPAGYTTSQLIFRDQFLNSTLDATKWISAIADQNGIWRQTVTAPYSAPNSGGYNAEFYDPAQVTTGGGLKIVAARSSLFVGYTWKAGCICTHGLFTFTGGFAQARIKQPDCTTGAWPAFWHLEGGAEIDTQEGGFILGATNVNRIVSNNLIPGGPQNTFDSGIDLTAGYHIYGMEYKPGVSIKLFFDGVLKTTYVTGVPSGGMTLLLNLQIATAAAAGFHPAYSASTLDGLEMNVSEVQVYH